MKTSKVKWTQSNGTFKDMNITEVEFENGDSGNNYHKTEKTKFIVGKTFQYEVGGTPKNPTIKFIAEADEQSAQGTTQATAETPQPKQWGKSPEESNRIARMNALTNAVNLCIAQQDLDMLNVFVVAQEFEKFICHGANATATAIETNKTNAGVKPSGIVGNFKEDMVNTMHNQQDDLPF